jgi:hypothetical protein
MIRPVEGFRACCGADESQKSFLAFARGAPRPVTLPLSLFDSFFYNRAEENNREPPELKNQKIKRPMIEKINRERRAAMFVVRHRSKSRESGLTEARAFPGS